MIRNKPGTTLIFLFFFSSGFAALLYQIVWLKYLNLLFGSTTYATAAVLSAFMFGLSVGSRLSTRFRFLFRSSLRTYGLLEIGIGLFAMSFPFLYSGLKVPLGILFGLLGPESFWYNLFTFIIAFVVLLVPTSFMGATLPILSHYLIQDDGISKKIGTLYAINTAGAVTGILLSAFILIPALGLHATVYVGVTINLVVGLICFLAGNLPDDISDISMEQQKIIGLREPILILYAISGLVALGYEVLWTRVLVLHLGSSVYSYAIMLAVFLLGISLGSYAAGRWIHQQRDSFLHFGFIQFCWAFSILLQMVQLTYFSDFLYLLTRSFESLTVTIQFLALFAGSLQALFLPTFFSGALFPIVVTRLWTQGMTIREASAASYSFNTIGGIAGSVFAGFFLLPLFGTQLSLLILAGINAALGVVALLKAKRLESTWQKAAPLLCGLLFLAVAAVENKSLRILESAGIFRMEGNEQLLHLEEDLSATISVEKRLYMGLPYHSLSVNGVNVAGTSPNLKTIQKLQGHIPMMLYGPTKNKSVLHIGFGSGGTAYSISLYPNTKITVVELSRGIVRNANAYFRSVNNGVVDSGKLQFVYFDGRSFLQNTRQTFDLILSDSIHPRYSGNGSLYTKDYYEIVYQKLNPGGVHSQWIPLYSVAQKNFREILRAFVDVFPETYVWYINSTINPYVIVTGKKGEPGIVQSRISEAFQLPEVQKDLKSIGIYNQNFLLDYFLFGKMQLHRFVSDFDPHIDDRMTVEYESSRVISYEYSWWLNFSDLLSYRERVDPYLIFDAQWDKYDYDRFFDATSFNLKGQFYFLYGDRKKAKQAFSEARNKNEIDREPFEFYHIKF